MTAPKITASIMQKPGFFGILWLREVTGFNPNQHCARSLQGRYANLLPGKGEREPGVVYSGTVDPSGFDFLYLCGVHTSFNLDLNLHVPMRFAEGKVVQVENEGVVATFIDAERLVVPPLPDDYTGITDEAFTRCRNFQFGWNAYISNVVVLADDPEVNVSDWASQGPPRLSTPFPSLWDDE